MNGNGGRRLFSGHILNMNVLDVYNSILCEDTMLNMETMMYHLLYTKWAEEFTNKGRMIIKQKHKHPK